MTIHLAASCPCLLSTDGGLLVPCTAHTLREHARHGHYFEAPCAICDMAADPHQSRHDAFAVWFCDDDGAELCGGCGNVRDPRESCPTCAMIARADES